uniref:Uncharacterized protein n=1 Tax=Pelusios castaneus TaxID=367368 RepID=A0A8C8RUK5_9SAUR
MKWFSSWLFWVFAPLDFYCGGVNTNKTVAVTPTIEWVRMYGNIIIPSGRIEECVFTLPKFNSTLVQVIMGPVRIIEFIAQNRPGYTLVTDDAHRYDIVFDWSGRRYLLWPRSDEKMPQPSECKWKKEENKGRIIGKVIKPGPWQCALVQNYKIIARTPTRIVSIQLPTPLPSTKEILSRSDPFWYYRIVKKEECDVQSQGQILYNYYGETEDFMTRERGSGTWKLKGIDFSYLFSFTWVTEPKITGIGPYVVKEDIRRQLIIDPTYSLKKVIINLAPISSIKPQCQKYTELLDRGWKQWLFTQVFPGVSSDRKKRSIIDTALGEAGTGLGILNSIDVEILANKLSMLGQRLGDLPKPLKNSLTEMSASQHLIADILPEWESSQRADHLQILDTVEAQAWTNDVIKDVIRDGMSGILPLEVKSAMWKHLSDFETDLHKWWRMINFTYNPQDDQITVYVLMISEAQRKWISPIIALGLNLHSSVMQPIGYKLWAIKQNNTWKTVELEACNEEPNVGYVCNNNAIQSCDVCLNRNKGECYYQLDPRSSNESMVVYVGRTCVCIRSWCTMFKVNHVYDIAHDPYENQCLCNISSLVSCDVEFTLPVTVNNEIQSQYQLYEQISPIPLGLNINLVRKLIEHPELQKEVEKAKENAQNVLITVHHSGITKHSWWRIFLGLSPTAKKYLNVLVHPIVMLLIAQIAMAITLLGNCDQRFLPQGI